MSTKLNIHSEKQKRLEKALRENLRKRKSQQREQENKKNIQDPENENLDLKK